MQKILSRSPLKGKYDTDLDRESAYEMLQKRAELTARKAKEAEEAKEIEKAEKAKTRVKSRPARRQRQGVAEAMFKSAARSIGRGLGSKLVRGILGSLLK